MCNWLGLQNIEWWKRGNWPIPTVVLKIWDPVEHRRGHRGWTYREDGQVFASITEKDCHNETPQLFEVQPQPECVRWWLQTNKRHERDNLMICNKEIATPGHLSAVFLSRNICSKICSSKSSSIVRAFEAMSNLVWCCSGDVAMAKGRHSLTCDIQSKVHWSSWNWVRALGQWFV